MFLLLNKCSKEKRQKAGFSLMELLITVFVLSIGILSTLLFFTNAMRSTEYARDLTEATSHAEYILEEIVTRDSLANITSTNWMAWSNAEGVPALPSETITVSYVNAMADPLDLTATVRWTKKSRENVVNIRTQITK